jgi:hypothetical protein
MKLHRNARTTPMSRLQLATRVLEAGWIYQAADGGGVKVAHRGQVGPALPPQRGDDGQRRQLHAAARRGIEHPSSARLLSSVRHQRAPRLHEPSPGRSRPSAHGCQR